MCAVKSRQNYNLAANSKYKGAAAPVQCVQTELTAVTSMLMASSFCLFGALLSVWWDVLRVLCPVHLLSTHCNDVCSC